MIIQVEYVREGLNKVENVKDFESAEKFIKENKLIKVFEPENENECRIISE